MASAVVVIWLLSLAGSVLSQARPKPGRMPLHRKTVPMLTIRQCGVIIANMEPFLSQMDIVECVGQNCSGDLTLLLDTLY